MKMVKVQITDLNKIPFTRAPIIYTWRRRDTWLYVGSSKHGTKRLTGHHIISRASFQPGDIVNVFILSMPITKDELEEYEYKLIKKYSPIYNKTKKVPTLEKLRLAALGKIWIQNHSV